MAFFSQPAEALELKLEDLSASVEVAAVFSLSLDNPHLAFGLINPGENKILGEGHFFHEAKCRSNNGRSWYLKAQLISLRLLGKEYSLPYSCLKWKISESTGAYRQQTGSDFTAFSSEPELVYTSEGDDPKGREVILRFQYSLTLPREAPAGNYVGQIIFTMTEGT